MMSSLYGDLPAAASQQLTQASQQADKPAEDDMFQSLAKSSTAQVTPAAAQVQARVEGIASTAVATPGKKAEVNSSVLMMAPRVAAAKKPPTVVGNASNIALDLMKLRMEKAQRQQEVDLAKAKTAPSPAAQPFVPSFVPSTSASSQKITFVKEEKKLSFMQNIMDEYDPLKPNDYDALMRQKAREKSKEDMNRREREVKSAREHDKKFEEKQSTSFASRMMKKMGWKEGEGLGKDGQGIAEPLIAQKTDRAAARIVQAAPLQPARPAQPTMVFTRPGAPTKILFLTNLVGKGEVDEDLNEEIREEASKYGTVEKVRICEAPDASDTEAVRIFVCFQDIAQARTAHQKFNGRFFGGRTVQARFYDVSRFEKEDLMPGPNE
eukprot:GEMP01027793.1.p1 GENE.GEMP01027793.1~~GEMP01027793.1.p1  ORF type:complete len:380 (-),score=112.62 GEMP01027793.1:1148-2287(-)